MSGMSEIRNLDLGAAPLMNEGTRRERKKPEFFTCQVAEKQATELPQGKGAKLRDIPNVVFRAAKLVASDNVWMILHKIMYKGVGKMRTRKKDVMAFSGFAFSKKEEGAGMERAVKSLNLLSVKELNGLIALFDIPKSGKVKAEMVESVASFLKEPKILSSVDISQVKKKPKSKKRPLAKGKQSKGQSEQKTKKHKKVDVEEDPVEDDMDVPAEEDPPEASGGAEEENSPDEPEEGTATKDEKENSGGATEAESEDGGDDPPSEAGSKEPIADGTSSEPAAVAEDDA